MMRDAYERLKSGPDRLLPRALNTLESTKEQWEEAKEALIAEGGVHLKVIGRHVFYQDRHILELEHDNHCLRQKIYELGEELRARDTELSEARRRNVSNKVHLAEYMKTAMYLQDAIKRVWKA